MDQWISEFSEKIRVRACGVYLENNAILLAKHEGLGPAGFLWSPPGGGVEFGETLEEAIRREFEEETGLSVEVRQFQLFHQFVAPPLHALEFFFRVEKVGGSVQLGYDPEMESDHQLLSELRFWTKAQVEASPSAWFHAALHDMW